MNPNKQQQLATNMPRCNSSIGTNFDTQGSAHQVTGKQNKVPVLHHGEWTCNEPPSCLQRSRKPGQRMHIDRGHGLLMLRHKGLHHHSSNPSLHIPRRMETALALHRCFGTCPGE